jgi:xylose isomerase
MDVCAQGLKAAVALADDGGLEEARAARYADWDTELGKTLMVDDLDAIAELVESKDIRPEPRSGRQERLENLVNRVTGQT